MAGDKVIDGLSRAPIGNVFELDTRYLREPLPDVVLLRANSERVAIPYSTALSARFDCSVRSAKVSPHSRVAVGSA
jgi:hypothetical protein